MRVNRGFLRRRAACVCASSAGIASVVFLGMGCTPQRLDGSPAVCNPDPDRSAFAGGGGGADGDATLPLTATIAQIQGAGHRSSLVDRTVRVTGVVTIARGTGFYLQSETPDSNPATSEAVFVTASDGAQVARGNRLTIVGRVTEARPGCGDCGPGDPAFDYLSVTEIVAHSVVIESGRAQLPAPVVIGWAGRRPPAARIDSHPEGDVEDPKNQDFDPCADAIDFYESLEHMLIRVDDARAVGPTTASGEIAVVGDDGRAATPRTPRGGMLLRPGDSNPERILIDDALVSESPKVDVGARFVEPIVGVMGYSHGNFKLFNSVPLIVEGANDLRRETLGLGDRATNQLDIATFNVENLSAVDAAERFDGLAEIVVRSLKAPDVLVLQEVQDDSGAADDGVVTSVATLSSLAHSIAAVGGPLYEFADVAPADGADGGQPGGNIRVALMVSALRGASLVRRDGASADVANEIVVDDSRARLRFSPGRIDPANAAFVNGRKPLAAEIAFRGSRLVVIANHLRSKTADEPLFGRWQPPTLVSEAKRHAEAQVVANFVGALRAADPALAVLVAGDFNDFEFSRPLAAFESAGLINAVSSLPVVERYTYVFAGNSQALDHVFLSGSAAQHGFAYDVVHVNAEFHDGRSDHDPAVIRVRLE